MIIRTVENEQLKEKQIKKKKELQPIWEVDNEQRRVKETPEKLHPPQQTVDFVQAGVVSHVLQRFLNEAVSYLFLR